jgi:Ni,Fe-hydrogenase I small subunit
MSSKDWWFEVVKNTYKNTKDLTTIEHDELDQLLPTVFELLYNDVFSTKEGWLLKDDAAYTLQKLREWRDQGAGPKIGVISNFDSRLTNILRGG